MYERRYQELLDKYEALLIDRVSGDCDEYVEELFKLTKSQRIKLCEIEQQFLLKFKVKTVEEQALLFQLEKVIKRNAQLEFELGYTNNECLRNDSNLFDTCRQQFQGDQHSNIKLLEQQIERMRSNMNCIHEANEIRKKVLQIVAKARQFKRETFSVGAQGVVEMATGDGKKPRFVNDYEVRGNKYQLLFDQIEAAVTNESGDSELYKCFKQQVDLLQQALNHRTAEVEQLNMILVRIVYEKLELEFNCGSNKQNRDQLVTECLRNESNLKQQISRLKTKLLLQKPKKQIQNQQVVVTQSSVQRNGCDLIKLLLACAVDSDHKELIEVIVNKVVPLNDRCQQLVHDLRTTQIADYLKQWQHCQSHELDKLLQMAESGQLKEEIPTHLISQQLVEYDHTLKYENFLLKQEIQQSCSQDNDQKLRLQDQLTILDLQQVIMQLRKPRIVVQQCQMPADCDEMEYLRFVNQTLVNEFEKFKHYSNDITQRKEQKFNSSGQSEQLLQMELENKLLHDKYITALEQLQSLDYMYQELNEQCMSYQQTVQIYQNYVVDGPDTVIHATQTLVKLYQQVSKQMDRYKRQAVLAQHEVLRQKLKYKSCKYKHRTNDIVDQVYSSKALLRHLAEQNKRYLMAVLDSETAAQQCLLELNQLRVSKIQLPYDELVQNEFEKLRLQNALLQEKVQHMQQQILTFKSERELYSIDCNQIQIQALESQLRLYSKPNVNVQQPIDNQDQVDQLQKVLDLEIREHHALNAEIAVLKQFNLHQDQAIFESNFTFFEALKEKFLTQLSVYQQEIMWLKRGKVPQRIAKLECKLQRALDRIEFMWLTIDFQNKVTKIQIPQQLEDEYTKEIQRLKWRSEDQEIQVLKNAVQTLETNQEKLKIFLGIKKVIRGVECDEPEYIRATNQNTSFEIENVKLRAQIQELTAKIQQLQQQRKINTSRVRTVTPNQIRDMPLKPDLTLPEIKRKH